LRRHADHLAAAERRRPHAAGPRAVQRPRVLVHAQPRRLGLDGQPGPGHHRTARHRSGAADGFLAQGQAEEPERDAAGRQPGRGWYLYAADKKTELEGLQQPELTLRAEFEDKQRRAATLEPLKQQLAQIELMLQQMLRQLPSKTEMPDLIVDVSQTALATGIS